MNVDQFYKENKGLVHAVSKKGYARLQAAGIGLDYDDVFQEMSVVFLKAYEGFDESLGNRFTTYYYMAAFNKINSWAQKMIDERLRYGVVSIEEMNSKSDGEDFNLEEILMKDNATPEAIYACSEFVAQIRDQLSPLAFLILEWVVEPPKEFMDELAKAEAHIQYAKSLGYERRFMNHISPRYVGQFIVMLGGVTESEVRSALAELRNLENITMENYF